MSIVKFSVFVLWLTISLGARSPLQTAVVPNSARSKPIIKIKKNGFPGGQDTPEGAAIDLAMAFISRDPKLFRQVCIPPFGGGENRKAYETFLSTVEASIVAESIRTTPSPGGPRQIDKLYAARHLSKEGPASYGYAVFDFQDVVFVDVVVTLHNGFRTRNRTLAIKVPSGKWFVHPAPDTCPLLSMGLNEEPSSTTEFTDAYLTQGE